MLLTIGNRFNLILLSHSELRVHGDYKSMCVCVVKDLVTTDFLELSAESHLIL